MPFIYGSACCLEHRARQMLYGSVPKPYFSYGPVATPPASVQSLFDQVEYTFDNSGRLFSWLLRSQAQHSKVAMSQTSAIMHHTFRDGRVRYQA
jgi:hypothetical protein